MILGHQPEDLQRLQPLAQTPNATSCLLTVPPVSPGRTTHLGWPGTAQHCRLVCMDNQGCSQDRTSHRALRVYLTAINLEGCFLIEAPGIFTHRSRRS